MRTIILILNQDNPIIRNLILLSVRVEMSCAVVAELLTLNTCYDTHIE